MYKLNNRLSLKKVLSFFAIIMAGIPVLRSQVIPIYIVNSKNYSFGNYSFCSDGGIISPDALSLPVNYSGTARVDYSANKYVELLPGFKAGAMATGGKFETHFYTPDFPVTVITPTTPGKVGLYEKLEFGLDLPAAVDNLVNNYFTTSLPLINPFDPDDIDITATFTSPSGTQNRTIHGFYYRGFTVNPSDTFWTNDSTIYDFRVRFAPTELGIWNCNISVSSPNNKFTGTYNVACLNFMAVHSFNKGYVEIGQDGRHLRFSGTHESFFAIGQNIPWIDHSLYWNTDEFHPKDFMSFNSHVADIGNNQGNYVRFLMAPWSHGIEWEKAGDYSGYTGNGPSGAIPQDRQHNAFELDKVFETCKQNGVYVHLNLEMQTGYNASFGETYYSWAHNPYNGLPGIISPADVQGNVDAKKYFKRRLRYIIARWGYSTNLAVIELLSEQDGWDGFGTIAGTSANSYTWHQEMGQYIKTTLGDHNHLVSTSYADRPDATVTPYNNFHLAEMDVTSGHKYSCDREMSTDARFGYMNTPFPVNSSEGLYVDLGKPTIFGELGLDNLSPMDQVVTEGCNDVNWHNNMWSTSFMGSFGTGLNWWQEWNPSFRSQNFPALHSFFSTVDFESNNYILPYKWKDIFIPSYNHRFEVLAIRNPSGTDMMGWAHNCTYWWGNLSMWCQDAAGHNPNPSPYGDDTPTAPMNYPGSNVQIGGLLAPLHDYNIDWYNTRGSGGVYSTVIDHTNIFGQLKPEFPGPDGDYGFKAHHLGLWNPLPHAPEGIDILTVDSLNCGEDTIAVNATMPEDTTGAYIYAWDFGNGQTASVPQATVIYSAPGSYTVTLIIKDDQGIQDTLSQIIVVPACDGEKRMIVTSLSESLKSNFSIFPNPNNGVFTLTDPNEEEKHIVIYNTMGIVFYEKKSSARKLDLNLSNEAKGIYFIKIASGDKVETKKIIKQ